MALCALDTNGYVELLRGGPRVAAIRAAMGAAGTALVVLMPVILELQQGARTAGEERGILQRFVDAVPPARRVAPTAAEWVATGAAVAAMRRAQHDPVELARRSFFLDVLVAGVCRSRGVVLWTDDRDHARVSAHVGHRFAPLPV